MHSTNSVSVAHSRILSARLSLSQVFYYIPAIHNPLAQHYIFNGLTVNAFLSLLFATPVQVIGAQRFYKQAWGALKHFRSVSVGC